MKFPVLTAAAAAFTLAALSTGSAFAYAPYSGGLSLHQVHHEAIAPLGFALFCLKNPDQCRSGGRAEIDPRSDTMSILHQVNLRVNRTMRPQADTNGDVWTVGATAGDCEDYVLNKRAELIRRGLSPSALRIAYVKTSDGRDHAVLVAKLNGSSMVLDNLTNQILPMGRTGLHVMSMSGADPLSWG
jgi:predicted transglutaminase-like cysteine proteinase